jgi:ubiquinone/menaquinone biosynthesis C-methylase UbiE
MANIGNQPDWDKIAEKFDLWLPHISPVGEALLSTLQAQSGDQILDLASGTGEPALSLARRFSGDVTITGIDSEEGMVKVAQAKVARERIANIVFHCMPAKQLTFADNSFDRALCRFGVMLFADPLRGLREMYRTLKPGGRFAMTVWGGPETMTTLCWAYEAFKNRLHEDQRPPLIKATSLGKPGALETLLQQAGFSEYAIDTHTFYYDFPSFEAYWSLVESSDILKAQYDVLVEDQRWAVREEIRHFAESYIQGGRLVVPHQYLLATGRKISN